jgi:hypothetical protein
VTELGQRVPNSLIKRAQYFLNKGKRKNDFVVFVWRSPIATPIFTDVVDTGISRTNLNIILRNAAKNALHKIFKNIIYVVVILKFIKLLKVKNI